MENADVKKIERHVFTGTNIVSKDYTRIHFFPANINTSSSKPWGTEPDAKEFTESVSARITHYDRDFAPFEVMMVERRGGKIIGSQFLQSTPVYEESNPSE